MNDPITNSPAPEGCPAPTGSASRRPMTTEELIAAKDEIQAQAIEFYDLKENFFAGERKRARWTNCVFLVADAWRHLGPQARFSGPTIYL